MPIRGKRYTGTRKGRESGRARAKRERGFWAKIGKVTDLGTHPKKRNRRKSPIRDIR